MSDYVSLKVPELKKLLQEKSLPVTGNKADLIARLQEHDKPKDPAPVRENEDEIDYSDDEVPTATKPAEPEKPAELVEPAPVPTEEKPVNVVEPVKDAANPTTATDNPAEIATEDAGDAEALKADFSAHLPASNADEETRKRAERAKRFGAVETDEDQKKAARAERFGVEQSTLVKGLDAALPEKRAPKRSREGGNADNERSGKRHRPGSRPGSHQRARARRQRLAAGGKPSGVSKNEGKSSGAKGKSSILADPGEKAKAEARAKRFAGGS
ncbi:hypothetical protein GGR54DRAFT_71917 [Hypoxylon sp. NC1633]|nr:hypothetical protein GGR54DRAFT_71917 [Hypoxylon sp. NC1633]